MEKDFSSTGIAKENILKLDGFPRFLFHLSRTMQLIRKQVNCLYSPTCCFLKQLISPYPSGTSFWSLPGNCYQQDNPNRGCALNHILLPFPANSPCASNRLPFPVPYPG